jgi:hypothetical protein
VTQRRFTLDDPPFAGLTGKGVRVAVVDSGVHPANPHIGVAVTGVRIGVDGVVDADFVDRIGHGTAVAAVILEKAPDVELVAVRVFDRALSTTADVLARAIQWSAANGVRLINLSLGSANPARAELLGGALDDAVAAGAIVVSAFESDGVMWLPGSLPNAVGVVLDRSCDRDMMAFEFDDRTQTHRWAASGYPRPIPGVPVERNLAGISFAVANVTGFLARLAGGVVGMRDIGSLARLLQALS